MLLFLLMLFMLFDVVVIEREKSLLKQLVYTVWVYWKGMVTVKTIK